MQDGSKNEKPKINNLWYSTVTVELNRNISCK